MFVRSGDKPDLSNAGRISEVGSIPKSFSLSMEANHARVRTPITVVAQDIPIPRPPDLMGLVPMTIFYSNVQEQPAVGDIVQDGTGSDFIVLMLDRLDPLHYLYYEPAPTIGVLPTLTWARIVKEVEALPKDAKTSYAYLDSRGSWHYRLPIISTYMSVSGFKLKKRSPLAGRQRSVVSPPRIRTETTTRIRTCSKPMTEPTANPSFPQYSRVRTTSLSS